VWGEAALTCAWWLGEAEDERRRTKAMHDDAEARKTSLLGWTTTPFASLCFWNKEGGLGTWVKACSLGAGTLTACALAGGWNQSE